MGETARRVMRARTWERAADRVTLDYEGRFLRRRRLTTDAGVSLIVDLPETVSLDEGDAFVIDHGRHIAVVAAAEPLLEVRAGEGGLVRLAWHIGNRHMPAQIEPDRILIRADHVIEDMLARLGAVTLSVHAPFRPEGGAYGHGRTHGHGDPPAPGHGHADGEDHGHSDG